MRRKDFSLAVKLALALLLIIAFLGIGYVLLFISFIGFNTP
ncbi:hypothetical protein LCAA2362_0645 [Lacticaseibacillus casei A2-362]|nr:hypothetical protein LCA32G_2551 [Lacticaseibacillus paracasei]EKQ04632.1 hypothetical protein LCACRF28_0987 [Lacticaseibacillus paracasei]EKQ07043.1 hypothetical protein LCAA2362_0645 [Lacticaseibacillus casei A2-362]EKQ17796.1 hypothetical protein LCAUW1_2808 [Lacticaseibacillus paracasei]EPD10846.1 hypothetical protein Lpp48_07543 [Lacticaseibacillus paracasei subsp. paracasei Lpp48]